MNKKLSKEIKYIGFYDFPGNLNQRVYSLAAINKMDYICHSLFRAGFKVHVISPSWSISPSSSRFFQPQTTFQLNNNKTVTLCPSVRASTKAIVFFNIILSQLWLFFWLCFKTKQNEKLLVYHSPWLSIPIRWAKRIKKFSIILEVEEVYGDVSSINPYMDILENKLINSAKSFIFSTELLAERLGMTKPYIVLYGTYLMIGQKAIPPDDGKIHLLYAGIIDDQKAGAFNAIESVPFLPNNYVLHIIGFGLTEKLIHRIKAINEISECKIFFHGSMNGEEYVEFCQKCHIGLSTQRMDGKYLETSFPSKVLSYLCLGLKVVSCYVECVAKSQIGGLLSYYLTDTPNAIAEAIQSVDLLSSDNSREWIMQLDRKFVFEIKSLLDA